MFYNFVCYLKVDCVCFRQRLYTRSVQVFWKLFVYYMMMVCVLWLCTEFIRVCNVQSLCVLYYIERVCVLYREFVRFGLYKESLCTI